MRDFGVCIEGDPHVPIGNPTDYKLHSKEFKIGKKSVYVIVHLLPGLSHFKHTVKLLEDTVKKPIDRIRATGYRHTDKHL